ncbi:sugar-specific transcriptional regulator TrmB [Thermonema lapsum]|jgi:sugar-specific transcriptional regulator TrmB|uniref:Sugar-specific transcriptional regulator TrmB n=1 Tax=Thermonema lapsum TaxID=28195 RepID=A0A846MSS6_9BACT|nr:hypothetical protein [Thermonema lapsum]NIK74684.1 sugar-specific transcriptional regulator TrmB [Thermonema lapsum]
MKNYDKIIKRIEIFEEKVLQLVAAHEILLEENKQLKEENRKLKDLVKRLNTELINFQNQYKISKIVASIAPDAKDAEELKAKIDEYIAEIDKCIKLLS